MQYEDNFKNNKVISGFSCCCNVFALVKTTIRRELWIE